MVANTEDDEESQEDTINYKEQYRSFKRKLKFLIYVSLTLSSSTIVASLV